MGYDNIQRITSKSQHLTQGNLQFDGTLNVGYDLTYTYGQEDGKKFQLANVGDVNYRTEMAPGEDVKVTNSHAYEYDANGNLVYVNTGRTKKDGTTDEKARERKLKWDEENRLLASDDDGFVTNYWYDADGERTVKTSGESEQVYVNSGFAGGRTNTARFSLYVSPYLVANQGGRYTKHIYIGGERIVSKIGDFASYGPDPRRIEYAGSEADAVTVDYDVKYSQQLQAIKDNYATFGVPYNGTDNDDYVNGEGFCCDDGSLEAAQAEAVAQANALDDNFQEGDAYENLQFYYHADHLGSTSYITNLDGDVVQHIEYVPFGEVFIEERNNKWNTPYLFNAKEFDEETGLYYYGARYYDPRLSLWMSTDPLQENYPNVSSYTYCHENPLNMIDPDGCGDYYTNKGVWLGTDNKKDDLTYLASEKKNGKFINAIKLGIAHSDFKRLANIIYHEAGTDDEKEALWLSHTVKNRAAAQKKTMLGLLLTAYSSVSKSDKQKGLSVLDNSNKAKAVRAGVIDALINTTDPTNGAQFWDGTDFLAWGLSSPNGTPQNKFEEYHTITIPQDIYNDFLKSQRSIYPKGTVTYYGEKYTIPASVFTNKANWENGSFTYSWPNASGALYNLKATGTAGHSIFWRIEKK